MGLTIGSNNRKGAQVSVSMSYRCFDAIRTTLHYALYGTNGKERVGWGGDTPWPDHPLTPLLHHSDCGGHLTPEECEKISTALYQTLESQKFHDALKALIEKQEALATVRGYQEILHGLGDQLDATQKVNIQHLSEHFEDSMAHWVLAPAFKLAYVLEFCARRKCRALFS